MVMRWIFASGLILAGIYQLRVSSSLHLALRRIVFLLFIASGFISLIFAEHWTTLSQKLGVESGTALLTYLVTFGFIFSIISNFRWRKEQEQRIVELARQFALHESKLK